MDTGLKSLRILVAEDNEHMRGLLVGMLKGLSIEEIREASDGREALEALRRWTADIAFVDFQMAPVDGLEFTRTVRTTSDTANQFLPIILLTGHAQLGRVKEARDAGVNEILVKPLDPKTVVERLKAVIQRQRPFVRSSSYVGPDRRRRAAADYAGPWRREGDPADRRKLAE